LARGLVEDGKIAIDWPENGEAASAELTREATKLLLNLVLLGIEALPRGGTVKVQVQSSGKPEIVVLALGDNVGLKRGKRRRHVGRRRLRGVDRALGPRLFRQQPRAPTRNGLGSPLQNLLQTVSTTVFEVVNR